LLPGSIPQERFGPVLLAAVDKDENGTEISRTDRFRFLYYDSVFKHKKLSVLIGFTTIFNRFLSSLIVKM
jgi:hypothetical protein